MIDLNFAHENPEKFITLIHKKDPLFNAALLIELDKKIRKLNKSIEDLRHRKNELAQQGKKGITDQLRSESIQVGSELKQLEAQFVTVQEEFKALYLRCPNIPFDDVPEGNKESNKVIRTYGQKPFFDFEIKNHLDLGVNLGWFDFEAAATMARSNFIFYRNDAVRLMYALVMFMLKHNASYGFNFVLPPYLVNEQSLEIAGNFPKFYDDVYKISSDGLFLIPTSEVAIANLYRNKIFSSQELPIRLTAATSCFRKEAGGYGAAERGLIRIHQFEKVELFSYSEPDKSNQEQEMMVQCAETILQKLNLHYRVSLLAAQDCSFQSARTYDIEIWSPKQERFIEVSSCSNCTDFQSRRGGMRYRKEEGGKTSLVHTLNASSLALPRLMVALMETYQNEDGTITIPEILKPWYI